METKDCINTKTQAEFDELMRLYEKKGRRWIYGVLPTMTQPYWKNHKENTCVHFGDEILYGNLQRHKTNGYTIHSLAWAKEQLEGKKEANKSKRYTYNKTYTRSDGVVFEKEKIDGKTIKEREENLAEKQSETNKIKGLLNSHRQLKF